MFAKAVQRVVGLNVVVPGLCYVVHQGLRVVILGLKLLSTRRYGSCASGVVCELQAKPCSAGHTGEGLDVLVFSNIVNCRHSHIRRCDD